MEGYNIFDGNVNSYRETSSFARKNECFCIQVLIIIIIINNNSNNNNSNSKNNNNNNIIIIIIMS